MMRWLETAADRGLEPAVWHDSWSELDAIARAHGVVGDTYATGLPGYDARRAYVIAPGGTVHAGPARWDATNGTWPAPGAHPFTHSSDREADREAGLSENRANR